MSAVVVIGNFDGVHRGHQSVLAQARIAADARACRAVVLTFDPHPNEVLGRGTPPRLTTVARRRELLLQHGADEVVVYPFTRELAGWTPERFAKELLAGVLASKAVVVGRNFRFGHKRAGDFATLSVLGRTLGFDAIASAVAGDQGGPFSSTRVRDAIAGGELGEASRVLGRPHELSGIVEEGDRLGRTLGFPTANLGGVEEMMPPHGVYAVRVRGERLGSGRAVPGVMNLGLRPTVDGARLRVEAHLFDVDVDLYGTELRVELVARLRAEKKFDGLDALKAQIAIDARSARTFLGV